MELSLGTEFGCGEARTEWFRPWLWAFASAESAAPKRAWTSSAQSGYVAAPIDTVTPGSSESPWFVPTKVSQIFWATCKAPPPGGARQDNHDSIVVQTRNDVAGADQRAYRLAHIPDQTLDRGAPEQLLNPA